MAMLAESLESRIHQSPVAGPLDARYRTTASQQKHSDPGREFSFWLQSYMGADFLMPEMHTWPISPDLGVLLIRLIESSDYDAVVEFGSGVSTVILAKALAKCVESANESSVPLRQLRSISKPTASRRRRCCAVPDSMSRWS
ncbi:MAG: hypothetical protein MZV65_32785 [Chromatiales bacterium]|nr:hypothetical protein [Chromatiales bacterium]